MQTHITISGANYSLKDVLFVFALESESGQYFKYYNTCFTGIGKVRATYYLMDAIEKYQPKIIINLGSAGSHVYKKGQMVACTKFIQRDMDLTPLGFPKYQTPFCNDPIVLENGLSYTGLENATCGSGDQFETQLEGSIYDVVDMEAFALAFVAKNKKIPFLSIKYITDGANDDAIEDWNNEIIEVPEQFRNLFGL